MSESMTTDPVVAALLRERAGYVQRDLPERVAAVDAELKARGHEVSSAEAAPSAPAGKAPAGRKAPAKRTAAPSTEGAG